MRSKKGIRPHVSPQGPTTPETPPFVERTRTRRFSMARNRATWKCWISEDQVFDQESLVMFTSMSAPRMMNPLAEVGERVLEADRDSEAERPPCPRGTVKIV